MDPVQTMPLMDSLIKSTYTIREWLNYYRNIWQRNLSARLIDVVCDTNLKKGNAEEMVTNNDNVVVPVKSRLEERKILVQDAVDLIAAIDTLLALSDEELMKQYSADALKVADDMLPKKAGDPCDANGSAGHLADDGKGGLTCVADSAPAVEATPAPEAAV